MCNGSVNCVEEETIIQADTCIRFSAFQVEHVSIQFVVLICVINSLLVITTTIGNTLVIYVILKKASLRSPSIFLLCALATTDLTVALVVQPMFLAMFLLVYSGKYNCDFEKMQGTATYTACTASLLTLTAINLDRLFAVRYHLRYSSVVTVPRVMYVTAINWLLSGFLASLTLWAPKKVFRLVINLTLAICLGVSTFVHLQIYRVVRHHQRQIQIQAETVQAGNYLNITRFKKSAANAFVIHYFLLFCYTQAFVVMSMTSRYEHNSNFASWNEYYSPIAWNVTTTLLFMNSSLNPLIYCWRFRELRHAVKGTIKEIFCRN